MAVFTPDTSALTVIYSTHSVRIDLSETFLPETQIPDVHGPCDIKHQEVSMCSGAEKEKYLAFDTYLLLQVSDPSPLVEHLDYFSSHGS